MIVAIALGGWLLFDGGQTWLIIIKPSFEYHTWYTMREECDEQYVSAAYACS